MYVMYFRHLIPGNEQATGDFTDPRGHSPMHTGFAPATPGERHASQSRHWGEHSFEELVHFAYALDEKPAARDDGVDDMTVAYRQLPQLP
jgi:hypothetical protein